MSSPTIQLNNGEKIPVIGLGTWQSQPTEVAKAVEYAIKEAGYRHIDCAWAYGNESEVGEGIRASGVPRSELFVTSKLWGTYHRKVAANLEETLKSLGTDYLDLYLVHWPIPLNPEGNHPVFPKRPDGSRDIDVAWDIADTWRQMEALQKAGKVKSIGVSNCSERIIERLLQTAEIVPAVNQLELHLYNPQHDLIKYLKDKGIVPQAYSPLGSTNSPLLKDETVATLASKYNTTPSSVLLGYLVAKGVVTLPKSVTPDRIAQNMQGVLQVVKQLTEEDLKTLDAVASGGKQHRFIKPPWGVPLGFVDWDE